MTGSVFVGTNVLIDARDRKNEAKRDRARAWLSVLGQIALGVINLQPLDELTRWILANEGRRSLKDVREEIDALCPRGDKSVDDEEVSLALDIRARFGFRRFDCLLIAAAVGAACCYFLTEDLTEGTTFGSVTLIQPIHTAPGDLLFRD